MKIITLALLLCANSAFATLLIPENYEETRQFFKVDSSKKRGRTMYHFLECRGDQETNDCYTIFSPDGYSESELNAIEDSEALKGTGILAAEIVTGGIIWKRLMKFTLGGAVKVTRKITKWREGVANGTVALAVMTPVNAGATVVILDKAEDALDFIDPISRFKRSELVDTDEFGEDEVIVLGYEFDEAYETFQDLLGEAQ